MVLSLVEQLVSPEEDPKRVFEDKPVGEVTWKKALDHKNGAIRGIDILDRESFVATGYVASNEISVPFISDESTGILLVSNQSGDIAWQEITLRGANFLSEKTRVVTICGTTWQESFEREHQDAFLVQFSRHGGGKKK